MYLWQDGHAPQRRGLGQLCGHLWATEPRQGVGAGGVKGEEECEGRRFAYARRQGLTLAAQQARAEQGSSMQALTGLGLLG